MRKHIEQRFREDIKSLMTDSLMAHERAIRNDAWREVFSEKDIKLPENRHEQTVYNDGIDLYLGMNDSHKNKMKSKFGEKNNIKTSSSNTSSTTCCGQLRGDTSCSTWEITNRNMQELIPNSRKIRIPERYWKRRIHEANRT